MSDPLLIRTGAGGAYWLAVPGADLDEALHEARNLPYELPDRGVKFGPGVLEIAPLDARTEWVELTWEVLDVPPFERFDAIFRSHDDVQQHQVLADEVGLEVRVADGVPTPLLRRGGVQVVTVLRDFPAPGEITERHRLLVFPDDFDVTEVVGFGSTLDVVYVEDEQDEYDEGVQYLLSSVQTFGDGQEPGSAEPRRLGLAILDALRDTWDEDDATNVRVARLTSDLTRLGAFDAHVTETRGGAHAMVDSRALVEAVVLIAETLLHHQPSGDRTAMVDEARRAFEERLVAHEAGSHFEGDPTPVEERIGRRGVFAWLHDGSTPLIRTCFGDDAGWERVVAAVTAPDTFGGTVEEAYAANVAVMSQEEFAGLTPQDVATWDEESWGEVILVDEASLANPDDPTVLYVDLGEERGRSFRCAASEVAGIEANLSIDNVDFDEFADEAERAPDGVYRGYGD